MPRPATDIPVRILRAARDRFLSEGVDGASLRAIARDAGTNIGMLYYYYPTKDELFLAVVEEVYSALLADLTEALAPGVPARERISRLYSRLGALSADETAVLTLVIREILVSSPRLERMVERFQRGHLPLILGTLADGVGSGEIDGTIPPPVLLIATFAIGVLPQMLRRKAGHLPPFAALPEPQALARNLVDVLFDGIGSPSRPA